MVYKEKTTHEGGEVKAVDVLATLLNVKFCSSMIRYFNTMCRRTSHTELVADDEELLLDTERDLLRERSPRAMREEGIRRSASNMQKVLV